MLYLKTLEKILDFQSEMVCVNKDQFQRLTSEYKRDLDGHGRQRLLVAQSKSLSLLNSFRVDFSTLKEDFLDKIPTIGKIIYQKENKTILETTEIKGQYICQIEKSTILPQDYARDHQITKCLPPFT